MTLHRLLAWALARLPLPADIVWRWWATKCPFCDTWRRDPTDYCPECHL